jgi:hypothetical protein
LVAVGTISFYVVLDTASADLWLASSACTTSSCRHNPTYPLAYNSSSFVSVNDNSTPFFVSYADGTGACLYLIVSIISETSCIAASGFVARETVQLSDLVVENQAFGETLCYSSLNAKYLMMTEALVNSSNVTLTDQTSGILGLGFPRLSEIYGSVVNGIGTLSLYVSTP